MIGRIIIRGRNSGLKCLSTSSLLPFPSLSSLFFTPNKEPVHRLLQGKIFGMSLSSRVYAEDGTYITNQISRIDVDLYQKFLPHGAKAKDGTYKKQGTWNRRNKIAECKMRKFKRGRYLRNEKEAKKISTEMQEKTGRWGNIGKVDHEFKRT